MNEWRITLTCAQDLAHVQDFVTSHNKLPVGQRGPKLEMVGILKMWDKLYVSLQSTKREEAEQEQKVGGARTYNTSQLLWEDVYDLHEVYHPLQNPPAWLLSQNWVFKFHSEALSFSDIQRIWTICNEQQDQKRTKIPERRPNLFSTCPPTVCG
jgi:hypothetical protein